MDRQQEAAARVDRCLRQMGLITLCAGGIAGVDFEEWCLAWGPLPTRTKIPPEIRQEFAAATIAYAEAMGFDEMAAGLREDLAKGSGRPALPCRCGLAWPCPVHPERGIDGQISAPAAPPVPPDPRIASTCDRTRRFLSSLDYLSVSEARQASELRHRLRTPGLGVLHEAVLFLGGVHPARQGQAALVADLLRLVGPPERASAREPQTLALIHKLSQYEPPQPTPPSTRT